MPSIKTTLLCATTFGRQFTRHDDERDWDVGGRGPTAQCQRDRPRPLWRAMQPRDPATKCTRQDEVFAGNSKTGVAGITVNVAESDIPATLVGEKQGRILQGLVVFGCNWTARAGATIPG